MPSIFTHDVKNLLTGPVRVLYAPIATTAPTKLQDIIMQKTPYTPVSGWIDFGATNDAPSYERDMDSEELFVDQATTAVLSKINEVTRTLTVSLAEHTPEIARIAEEGAAIETIVAAGTGTAAGGAQKGLAAGTIDTVTRRRIAMIAQRDPGFGGVVTEVAAGLTRGPLVGLVLFSAGISAEGSEVEIEKDELAGRELEFTAYADSGIADTQKNTIKWLFEDAPQTLPA